MRKVISSPSFRLVAALCLTAALAFRRQHRRPDPRQGSTEVRRAARVRTGRRPLRGRFRGFRHRCHRYP